MKSPISEFCDSRLISDSLKHSFSAYIRSEYSRRFKMSLDGETVQLLLGRMSQEDLEDAWKDFTNELAKYLAQQTK